MQENRGQENTVQENTVQSVGREVVFYDGDCALCHFWVKFLLARDTRELPFLFSPIESELFGSLGISVADIGDTMCLVDSEGLLRVRSEAALAALDRVGGVWKVIAQVGYLFPRVFRDWVYDRVASVRKKIFGTTKDVCPMVPQELSTRIVMSRSEIK